MILPLLPLLAAAAHAPPPAMRAPARATARVEARILEAARVDWRDARPRRRPRGGPPAPARHLIEFE